MVVTYLVLLAFSYNVIFLFVGTASLGLFLSSTFPSMLAYTEDILQYKGECVGAESKGAGCHFLPQAPSFWDIPDGRSLPYLLTETTLP